MLRWRDSSKPTIFLGLTSLFAMLYLRYKQTNGRVERGERLTDLTLVFAFAQGAQCVYVARTYDPAGAAPRGEEKEDP
jgi:hypothetical protein